MCYVSVSKIIVFVYIFVSFNKLINCIDFCICLLLVITDNKFNY